MVIIRALLVLLIVINNLYGQSSLWLNFPNDSLWGYIDSNGREILSPRFEEAEMFQNGFAAIKQNGKYGIIDTMFKTVIPCIYDFAMVYNCGVFAVCDSNSSFLIDKNNIIIESWPEPGTFPWIQDSLYVFPYKPSTNGKVGLKDLAGNYILKPIYDKLQPYFENFSVATLNGEKILIRKNKSFTKMPIKSCSTTSYRYFNGKCWFQSCSTLKFGFLDTNLRIVIKPVFDIVDNFEFKFSKVEKDGYFGIIDLKGNLVVKLDSLEKQVLSDFIYSIRSKGKFYIYQFTDSNTCLGVYDKLVNDYQSEVDEIIVSTNGRYGVISGKGELIVPIKYEYLQLIDKHLYYFSNTGEYYHFLVNDPKIRKAGYLINKKKEILLFDKN